MSNRVTETLVGLFVLLLAGGFAVYAGQTIGNTGKGGSINYIASFASVGGVATGTDVRLAGVKIGTVTKITLDTDSYDAKVNLQVQADIPVPEDSLAKIVSDGLLGGAYISIEPGAEEEMLQAGDSFEYTQGAVDLLGLLGQFAGGKDDSSSE
jgi:phospholipid/cholesterol/gamma-HCH transport system substrate-binding protein